MSLSKKKRKEIKDAANTIGSVIAQQMHSEQQKKAQERKNTHPLHPHILTGTEAAMLRKKKLLIGGTCVFALGILLSFWVLQIKTMLYDVSLAPRQDTLSIVGAQEEFDSVLTELERLENLVNTNAQAAITAASSSISQAEAVEEEQQTKKDIQAALEELIAAQKNSSTSSEQ